LAALSVAAGLAAHRRVVSEVTSTASSLASAPNPA
jgi:hypothetical protein